MLTVIGIDPGPVSGLARLTYREKTLTRVDALQCTAALLPELFERLAREAAVVAVEQFVVGRGSMRAGHDGAVTRDLIGALQQIAPLAYLRTASEVKPWASDLRMAAAGLLEPTKQLRHARDAARHALFAAVADCGIPDPLSRKARS